MSMPRCCGVNVKDLMVLLKYDCHIDDEGALIKKTPLDADKIQKDIDAENERRRELWKERRLKPSEVALHNQPDDCWLSWNGTVRNLTPVVTKYKGTQGADVILTEAGKDVTHWFDKQGNLRSVVSRQTGIKVPFLLKGELPQTYTEVYPSGLQPEIPGVYWWKEDSYIVGHLTSNTRLIALTNTLAVTTAQINVCEEDTMELILMRYLPYNTNAMNYTWKYEGRKLDMTKTLAENSIPDFAKRFRELGMPEDTYIPNIFLFFEDNIQA